MPTDHAAAVSATPTPRSDFDSRRRRRGLGETASRWGFATVVVLTAVLGGLRAGEARAAVYLEDSPAAMELADEAADLYRQGRLGEAAQRLQTLADEYPQKLMPRSRRVGGAEMAVDPGSADAAGDGVYLDAGLWVIEQLRRDAALLAAYRQRYEVEAQRALEQRDRPKAWGDDGTGAASSAALMEVWDRYRMTPAGLEAGLMLAGRAIEAGDAESASRRLDELDRHPDARSLPAQRRRAELRAWSLAMQSESSAWTEVLEDPMGEESQAAADRRGQLRETLARLRRPNGNPSAAESTQPGSSPPPLDRPLWQTQLGTDEDESRRQLQPRTANTYGNQADGPVELRPVPAGGLLLVHDGGQIVALDQVSGRQRWSYETVSPEDPAAAFGGFQRRSISRQLSDERSVIVDGSGVFAVVGDMPLARPRNRFVPGQESRLVRLDLESGRERWSLSPDQLEEGLQSVSLHGTPVVDDGRVLVMARRIQPSSFQDSYLIAVDAETGRMVWRRHLGSSAGPNRGNGLAALSQMTLVDGVVYFCDNIGVAAAVDARRGVVRWVRVLADSQPVLGGGGDGGDGGAAAVDEALVDAMEGPALRVAARGGGEGAEVLPFSVRSSPQLVEAGLVLPVQVGDARGLVLDPADGSVRQRLTPLSPIASAYELAAIDGDLLVIGPRLSRLDGASLAPRWQEVPATARRGPEGYPKVTRLADGLLVARDAQAPLRELDWATGALRAQRRLPQVGRVVLANGGWVVTAGRQIGSYLDWSAAYDEIQQRAAAQPEAIEPGLSMALLAANAGRGDAVEEGVARAMAALAQAGPADDDRPPSAQESWEDKRRQVFLTLIGLARHPAQLSGDVVERLFDRLATTMQRSDELVSYHLERGAFYERQDRPIDAVAAYQQVLLDRSDSEGLAPMSAVAVPQADSASPDTADPNEDTDVRRGGFVARQRLVQLVQKHGRSIYAVFDRRAEQELAAIQSLPGAQSEALLSIGRRYPLAAAVAEATLRAGQLQLQSPRPGAAVVSLRQAFHLAQDDAVRGEAAGTLAEFYASHSDATQALRWLDQVAREHPTLELMVADQRMTQQSYRDRLVDSDASADGTLQPWVPWGEPKRVEGSMVREWETAKGPGSDTTLLLTPRGQPRQMMLYEIASGETRWRIVAPNPDLRLVHLGEDSLLLWSPTTGRLHGLDAATGQPLWPAISPELLLNELTGGVLAELRREHAGTIITEIEADFGPIRRPQEEPAIVEREDSLNLRIVADQAVVTLVAGDGRAAGIDRYTGQVLWQWTVAVDRVTHVQVVGGAVAIAGLAAPDTEAQASRILMIDAVTGRSLFPAVEDAEAVTHLQPTAGDDLLAVSNSLVRRLSRSDGSTQWRREVGGFAGEPTVAQAGGGVWLMDDRRVVSLDLEGGDVLYDGPHQLDRDVKAFGDGRWISRQEASSQVLDGRMQLLWRDAIYGEGKRLVAHQPAGDHLILAGLPESQPRGRLMLYALECDTGRLVAQTQLSGLLPNPIPEQVRPLRGHLLLQGRDWVLLLPSDAKAAAASRDR